MEEKFKILKVTMEVKYYIPMPDKEIIEESGELRTKINGWPMSQVKKDWFETHDINQHHATRKLQEDHQDRGSRR